MITPLITTGRILVIDDNANIHEDFRKILGGETAEPALEDLEKELFGTEREAAPVYRLDFASQGEEAVELVRKAVAEKQPYGMAFVDMRMPPGWDGLRTMEEMKKIDPVMNFVVCSAYSDFSDDEICQRLELRNGILYLAKPFDPADARKLAGSLSHRAA